jgi:predicted ATPase
VAYGSLIAEQRSALHRKIVDAIERLYRGRENDHIEQLAHHAVRGELREKAVGYLRQAGLKAASSAAQEAESWFEQALEIMKSLPVTESTIEQAFEIRLQLRQLKWCVSVRLP